MKLHHHLLYAFGLSLLCLAVVGWSLMAATVFLLMTLAVYGLDILRVLRASVVNKQIKRAARSGNRAVSSATPARPTLLAARNAPGARASLLTVNPQSILH